MPRNMYEIGIGMLKDEAFRQAVRGQIGARFRVILFFPGIEALGVGSVRRVKSATFEGLLRLRASINVGIRDVQTE